jgi:hypothetical protein
MVTVKLKMLAMVAIASIALVLPVALTVAEGYSTVNGEDSVDKVTITLYGDETVTVDANQTVSEVMKDLPHRNGYTLTGLSYDDEQLSSTTVITNDMSGHIVADWTPIRDASLNLANNGGLVIVIIIATVIVMLLVRGRFA